MSELLMIIGAYLLGSIPFGLLLTRIAGHGDIRTIGSGNIGATNVMRTGSKKLAITTLLLDIFKGTVAVFLAQYLQADLAFTAGFFALVGHMFPIWLKCKGGKGVATLIGVIFALYWPLGLAVVLTWFGVFIVFRISSLAALIAFSMAPLYAFLLQQPSLALFAFLAGGIVIIKHRENIVRLLKGEEPRFTKKPNG